MTAKKYYSDRNKKKTNLDKIKDMHDNFILSLIQKYGLGKKKRFDLTKHTKKKR